jgi:hypothetical protein
MVAIGGEGNFDREDGGDNHRFRSWAGETGTSDIARSSENGRASFRRFQLVVYGILPLTVYGQGAA